MAKLFAETKDRLGNKIGIWMCRRCFALYGNQQSAASCEAFHEEDKEVRR
jgi:hypothetical protein